MPQGRIIVCAVIGREDDVLVVRQPGGGWTLPGARVEHGEWVQDALARGVRDVLSTGTISASFLCLIEESEGLVIVFDVTPDAESHLPAEKDQPALAWVALDQLASLDLWPAALRDVLLVGEPPSWLSHHES